jgi:hypothetical protein
MLSPFAQGQEAWALSGPLGLKFLCADLIVKKEERALGPSVFLFNFEEAQEPLDESGLGSGFRKGVLDGERALNGIWLCQI